MDVVFSTRPPKPFGESEGPPSSGPPADDAGKLFQGADTGNRMADTEKVNLDEAFEAIDDHWSPRVAAELNGQAVKLAKADGEFVWHHHDEADELFLVISGSLRIEFHDRPDAQLDAGEFVVVPQGVEHRPVATEETELLLFEPQETRNTGNVTSERTVDEERL